MRSTVGLLSSRYIGSPSARSGSTSGSSLPQDHLVIQLAIDPAFDDPLDVAEVDDHVAAVEAVGAHVDLDRGVVAVRVLADAVVVEQPVAVAEFDPLGDEVHVRRIISEPPSSSPAGSTAPCSLADAAGRGAAPASRPCAHLRQRRASRGKRRSARWRRGCSPRRRLPARVEPPVHADVRHARRVSRHALGRARRAAGVRHARRGRLHRRAQRRSCCRRRRSTSAQPRAHGRPSRCCSARSPAIRFPTRRRRSSTRWRARCRSVSARHRHRGAVRARCTRPT